MGLYQKHRPTSLEDVMGNDATLEGIRGHFAQAPHLINHAHVIHGGSGCGKTTLARAIARNILGATDLTIREINTADNRGIDTIREIIDQLRFMPVGGKALVYIIDEAHGLSKDAKRALLKPLEDTPKHVYFFLCTTNLAELLKGDEGGAISTRVAQWKVEPLPTRMLFRLVDRVAKAEGVDVDDDVLQACAKAAEGSPRAALVALEKVLPIANKESQLEVLESPLEEDPSSLDFCRALCSRNWSKVAPTLAPLKGGDVEKIRRGVLGYMAAILLKGWNDAAAANLEAFSAPTYDTGFPGLVRAAALACSCD